MDNDMFPLCEVNGSFNEALFCSQFLRRHPLRRIGKTLYTEEGQVADEDLLRKEIYEILEPHKVSGLAKKAASLLDAIKMKAYTTDTPICTDRIHVANGTLFLDGRFTEQKEFCFNRLPVAYRANAEPPSRWLRFLDDLLFPEDIPTLQEFMGYCLIPTTKAQKMLFLVGRGGEGKSRIGLVMNALLGSNMKTGSIQKVETNRFAAADLERILLMVDDDMKLEALPQTNNIKSIVTAELPRDLEQKGKQSYQGTLYVRFMVFGNGTMKSLYDRSEGFFRRQLILTVKDREPGRVDDPYIGENLCKEAEGILLWALDGLMRLIRNSYRFTISSRTQANMESAIREGNNVVEFMESTGYFAFKPDGEISSRNLYLIYQNWCLDNAYPPVSSKSLTTYLHQHDAKYGLSYSNCLCGDGGRRVRGFLGMEASM